MMGKVFMNHETLVPEVVADAAVLVEMVWVLAIWVHHIQSKIMDQGSNVTEKY